MQSRLLAAGALCLGAAWMIVSQLPVQRGGQGDRPSMIATLDAPFAREAAAADDSPAGPLDPQVTQHEDCNGNGIPDDCDVACFISSDLNANGVPDECEPDCNDNGVPDEMDVVVGYSADCDGNDVPDECQPGILVPEPPAAGDECVDAGLLCPGVAVLDSTSAAAADAPVACGSSPGQFAVWYCYRPDTDDVATISVCGTPMDVQVSVHDGCPQAGGSMIACTDDDCLVSFPVQAGAEYLVRVAGAGDLTGTFALGLTGPDCIPGTSSVRNAILYAPGDVGPLTAATAEALGIQAIPVVYSQNIDPNQDGIFDFDDHRELLQWALANVPVDYDGPVCLDYEVPYWPQLAAPTIEPAELQAILDVYIEIIEFAKVIRPRAQWGFWGIPMRRHVSPAWQAQGLSVGPLLAASEILFPAAYDCHPGEWNAPTFATYMIRTMEAVQGQRPVLPFIWNRYCGFNADGAGAPLMPEAELYANATAVVTAEWTSGFGETFGVEGLALWDEYPPLPTEAGWEILDPIHACQIKGLHELVSTYIAPTSEPHD